MTCYRLLLLWLLTVSVVQAQTPSTLNVTVVPGPSQIVPLVKFDDEWRYFKGTQPPQPNWKEADEGQLLVGTWLTGRGGFGYGDNDDNTQLSDMNNNYSTLYIRKTFNIPATLPADYHLFLRMDFDDGFVAYIDGKEVMRMGIGGTGVGQNTFVEPTFDALGASHEASAGGGLVELFDLGPVLARFPAGNHILAIIGANQAKAGSSDFSLIADLYATPQQSVPNVFTKYISRASDNWRYFKGLTPPQPGDWKTAAESALDGNLWLRGPGGFGFEDADDATYLADMRAGAYTTLYIRRSFTVPANMDPNYQFQLLVDYDDGYVAYIDGQEVKRSNAPGEAGTEPAFSDVATADREASRGRNPERTTLSAIPAGNHTLAILGLNRARDSSDFSLTADIVAADQRPIHYYTPVQTNSVLVQVVSTGGAARIRVNGQNAALNREKGWYQRLVTLAPMMNEIVVEALDGEGEVTERKVELVLFEEKTASVSGSLTQNTVWDATTGVVRLTGDYTVPAGKTLTLAPGAVVLLPPGKKLTVSGGGVLNGIGTAAKKIYIMPADTVTPFGPLEVTGAGSQLNLGFVEMAAGQIQAKSSGELTLDQSHLYDYKNGALIDSSNAGRVTMTRSILERYQTISLAGTLVQIQETLFRASDQDALYVKGSKAGSYVRRSTFQDGGSFGGEGLETGGAALLTVDRCLFLNYPGGLLLSENSDVSVYGNLLINAGNAILVADGAKGLIYNNTIAGGGTGLRFFEMNFGKGPGQGTAYNNIIWNVSQAVSVEHNANPTITYSDLSGAEVFPGTGNLNADPLFMDVADQDYRLQKGSPAARTGLGGIDMGAFFPVGGRPDAPKNLTARFVNADVEVAWIDPNDNETLHRVQYSQDATNWIDLVTLPANAVLYLDRGGRSPDVAHYYRAKTQNFMGESLWSNIASTDAAADSDGDGIPNDIETSSGLDPSNPADGLTDKDGDGMKNIDEFNAGTGINDKTSYLRFISIQAQGASAIMKFEAIAEKAYSIEYTSQLKTGSWTKLTDFPPSPTTKTTEYTDSQPKTAPRYYRLVLQTGS